MIFGPDGRKLVEPIPEDQDGPLYAELDPAMIALAKATADPVGHYARPDVLSLVINRAKGHVVYGTHEVPRERLREPVRVPEVLMRPEDG
jgi:aliphatic nitrilase